MPSGSPPGSGDRRAVEDRVVLAGGRVGRAVRVRRSAGTARSCRSCRSASSPAADVPLLHRRGSASGRPSRPRRRPAPRSSACPRAGPGRCRPATGTASRSPSRRPTTLSRSAGVGTKPVVQSAAVVVPPVPAVAPPEKTFLTCQVLSAFGPGQLLREHRRVGRGLACPPRCSGRPAGGCRGRRPSVGVKPM